MICLTLFHHLGRAEARPCSAAVPAAIPLSLKLTPPADICSHLVYLDFKDLDSDKKKATKQNERNDETGESTDLERDVSRVHVPIKHDKYTKTNPTNKTNFIITVWNHGLNYKRWIDIVDIFCLYAPKQVECIP